MTQEELAFLRDFYRAVLDRPLEFEKAEDPRYVPFYESPLTASNDPVRLLARPIEFSRGQSVQFLSGLRGSGKSTELRRLRQHLEAHGNYKVFLVDIENYINLSQSIDVSTFLKALADGFRDALLSTGISRIDIMGADVSPDIVVENTRAFVKECVTAVKRKYGPGMEVVLLLDSVEHIRGVYSNATAVQDSAVNLFTAHGASLRFESLHVIYTVPLYFKTLKATLRKLYVPGNLEVLPALQVHGKERQQPVQPVLDLFEQLISRRGDWRRLLGTDARGVLDELILMSGGNIRGLLRLFAEIITRADQLPVPRSTVDSAIQQCRSELLPIANDDAVLLGQVMDSHNVNLQNALTFQRLLDAQLILNYRESDGEEWYDVHPLLWEQVKKQASGALEQVRTVQEERPSPHVLAEEAKLTVLRTSSFRLLRSAELCLDPPLAVIVGPNQSGKSSVLDALQLMAEAAQGNLSDGVVRRRGGFSSILTRGAEEPVIRLEVELRASTGQLLRYGLHLGPVGSYDFAVVQEELSEFTQDRWAPLLSRAGGQARLSGRPLALAALDSRESLLSQIGSVAHPVVKRVQEALASIAVYPYFRTGAAWADPEAVPMRRPARLEPGARLHNTGSNLAAALSTMRDERPEDWKDFLQIVRLAFPRLKDLRLPAVSRGMVQLFWDDIGGNSFDAFDLSDGTLSFLAILCALFQPGSALIAVDEPEAHLHPDALIRLVGAARSLSALQPILLTTQSDNLIGLLDETPESIVVAQREDDSTRLVRPNSEHLREWLKGYSLRDIRYELEEWRTEP